MIKKKFGETSETAKQFRFETAKHRNSHSENEGETTKQRNSCSENKAETAKQRNSRFDQNFALWVELVGLDVENFSSKSVGIHNGCKKEKYKKFL